MAGTFVATPSKALTIEHEPTGRALTQFKPEEVRTELGQIEVLAAYGVKLRDDNKLRELAIAKLETIADIMIWWSEHVKEHLGLKQNRDIVATGPRYFSEGEALKALGYSPTSRTVLIGWRKWAKGAREDADATVEKMVNGWKMRAGMLAPPPPKEKPDQDRDLAVESIFRAYTKLDPDQRIELKQKIMAFEKSYKDPFAPKAV